MEGGLLSADLRYSSCECAQYRDRALNRLAMINSTAVAVVTVRMGLQSTSLPCEKHRDQGQNTARHQHSILTTF